MRNNAPARTARITLAFIHAQYTALYQDISTRFAREYAVASTQRRIGLQARGDRAQRVLDEGLYFLTERPHPAKALKILKQATRIWEARS
jgi:hypothetical protein